MKGLNVIVGSLHLHNEICKVRRSTIGHCALRKRFTAQRPAVWGK